MKRRTAIAIGFLVIAGFSCEAFAQGRGGGAHPQSAGAQGQHAQPQAPGRFTSTMKFVSPPPDTARNSFPFGPFAPGLRRGPFSIGAFWFWGGGLWAPGILSFGYGYGAGVVIAPPIEGAPVGGVQLDIDPRRAQVYVDGAYAGVVEEFSGYFNHLELTAGPHVITIIAPDYEPLILEVIVTPGATLTQRGTLARAYGR